MGSLLGSDSLPNQSICPARSPGILGVKDASDPNQSSMVGPTPGPAGVNDKPASTLPGTAKTEKPDPYAELIKAVDSNSEMEGAGISLIVNSETILEVRGGPRRKWVFIPLQLASVPPTPQEEKKLRSVWDQWGGTILSCGSTAASGVVIYLSGGTALLSPLGLFTANSAALCASSFGKVIFEDEWNEFEREGGSAYTAWMTIETLMALADLCNGIKGAVGLIKSFEQAGNLAKLAKAIGRQKLTRKQLIKLINEIDPKAIGKIQAGKGGFLSKGKLVVAGQDILEGSKFKSLTNQQARIVVGAIGDALTLLGTDDTFKMSQKSAEIWFIQYEDSPPPD